MTRQAAGIVAGIACLIAGSGRGIADDDNLPISEGTGRGNMSPTFYDGLTDTDAHAAVVALAKVVDGETTDTPIDRIRARSFLARAIGDLGFVIPAVGRVEGRRDYAFVATLLAKVDLPLVRRKLGDLAPDDIDGEPADVREALRYYGGEAALDAHDPARAAEFWRRVGAGDHLVAARGGIARLDLAAAIARWAGGGPATTTAHAGAVAALVAAGRDRDPRVVASAVRTLVEWTWRAGAASAGDSVQEEAAHAFAEGRAGLAALAPHDARAAFEAARFAAGNASPPNMVLASLDGEVLEAAVGGVRCGAPASTAATVPAAGVAIVDARATVPAAGGAIVDARATVPAAGVAIVDVRATVQAAGARATELARALDADPDAATRSEAIGNWLATVAPSAADRVVGGLLATPEIDDAIALVQETDHELAVLAAANRDWQATAIAGEIRRDLTSTGAVARVDLATLETERLHALPARLGAFAARLAELPASTVVPAPASACDLVRLPGGVTTAAAAIPAGAANMRGGGAPARGCGCAASGEGGAGDLGGIAVAGVVVGVARRRRVKIRR